MSLQVWLPFVDGTLKQQGLSDAAATSGGTVNLTNVGKLGKCATFGSAAGGLTIPASTMTSFSECSVAFWLKINGLGSSYDTYFQAGMGSTPWAHYIFGFLRNNTNSTICFTISNGSSASNASYLTSALSTGIWYHVTLTYEAGKCKIYLDGNLDHEYNTSIVPAFDKITKITLGRGNNDSSYQTQCSMNDFRIYDHCLSSMEVKELAKGLILHYPLNRGGFGQDNSMPNSIEMPVGSANPSTGTWRLAGSSQMTRSRVAISDAPSGASTYGFQSVGLQTGQDASCWGIDGFPRENGTTYTLSAWGRIVGGSSTAAMLGFSVYSGTTLDYGGTYGKAVSSDTKYYGSGAYDYAGGQLNPNGNWTRIYRTFTSTSASDNIYIGFNTAKTGNNVTLQLCGVKLEKGDKMTPWIPNGSESMYTTLDLNGTTEYDCSGFCNNGTRTGTFDWTSDTPKYSVSTKFAKGTKITSSTGMVTESNPTFTCNFWINTPTGTYTQYNDVITFNGSAQFRMETSNTTGTQLSWFNYPIGTSNGIGTNGSVSNNTWNMFTITCDGSIWKTYKNGVFASSRELTGTVWTPNGSVSLGDAGMLMSMSDVRIYATALSADDVKSLYQNSAYIDSSGNVYGTIHEI